MSGPTEFSPEATFIRAVVPDEMRDALLAEVERMSDTPLLPQQRAERIGLEGNPERHQGL